MFGYAFSGLKQTYLTESNFRFHVVVAVLVLLAGWLFQISSNEWLWILLAITLVLAAELLNTALESLTNIASPQIQPLAKKTKDAAAAAVLLCALFALGAGIVIFGERVLALISSGT